MTEPAPNEINRPQVFIGVPVYNSEDKIGALLESIRSQSCSDFKVLITDNASADNTQSICEAICAEDSRFQYVRQPKNKGSTWAVRYVLEQADAEFFCWAASDTKLYPEFLESLIEPMLSDPQIMTTYSGVVRTKTGQPYTNHADSYSLMDDDVRERVRVLSTQLSLGTAVYGLHRCAMMKELFFHPRSGSLDMWTGDGIFQFGDFQLLLEILLLGKIKQLNAHLLQPSFDRNTETSHLEYIARLERYHVLERTCIAFPFTTGIGATIRRLYQAPLDLETVEYLESVISQVTKARFSELMDLEVQATLRTLNENRWYEGWSEETTEKSKEEFLRSKGGLPRFYLFQILREAIDALKYNPSKEVYTIINLCIKRISGAA